MIITGASFDEVWPLVRDHHYAHRRPGDPMYCFAARLPGGLLGDTGEPMAAIVFSSPANAYFGVGATELVRLVRAPGADIMLSKFVAWALRWLRKNTDLLYCLSYADQSAGHHGGIYQALNFTHVRVSRGKPRYVNRTTGETCSQRSFDQRRPEFRLGWDKEMTGDKFLYVYPLNESRKDLLERFGWKALLYPKPRAEER